MLPEFLEQYWPTPHHLLHYAPIALVILVLAGSLTGHLTLKRGWKTNYTRKVFHFIIFSSVTVIGSVGGLKAVTTFGGVAGLYILLTIYLGEGHPFYEAIARKQDAPHRTYYILVPFCATAAGGLVSNGLFGEAALVGYIVTGWGDAVGEPFGVRFGRHKYRVPTMAKVVCYRSYEGSAAVGTAAILGAILVMAFSMEASLWLALSGGILVGLVVMAVESVSPHGSDNFTTQVAGAAVAWLIMSL